MKKKAAATVMLVSLVTASLSLGGGNAYALAEKQVFKDGQGEIHTIAGDLGLLKGVTPQDRAIDALEKIKSDYGIRNVRTEFVPKTTIVENTSGDSSSTLRLLKSTNPTRIHTRLDRVINGIPIFGEQLIVHENNGRLAGVTGKYKALLPNTSEAAVSKEDAVEKAIASTGFSGELSVPATSELMYYPMDDQAILTYKVTVCYLNSDAPGDWVIFVNAADGTIVKAYNTLNDIKNTNLQATGTGAGASNPSLPLHTVKKGTRYYLEDRTKEMYLNGGTINTYSFRNGSISQTYVTDTDNNWGDEAAVDAHYNIGKVYDYLLNVLGRNSFDDKGATIISGVHYSTGYNNAFWSSAMQQMVYGDGDGDDMSQLAAGLDVTAHELFHAVTDHTAELLYEDESGALNESWSDAFGTAVENRNWMIGEDIWTPGIDGDALRYMDNPNHGGQPDKMSDYYSPIDPTEDNGGVHTNSGIPNKAFYNFATSIGSRQDAMKVWYLALIDYMTPTTNFSQARAATLLACKDIYGEGSSEYSALQQAWDDVEVYDEVN